MKSVTAPNHPLNAVLSPLKDGGDLILGRSTTIVRAISSGGSVVPRRARARYRSRFSASRAFLSKNRRRKLLALESSSEDEDDESLGSPGAPVMPPLGGLPPAPPIPP